ncbi:MAG: OLD family endonuclease [Verrucomicrobia bacterium]|nr:MAG: OLD family endonuclease [Verrucomicrobiota bacterium]
MRLKKARVRKYRSIRDSGWFDIEPAKTIMVGPNESGKTALLEALQKINPPGEIRNFSALRDYPRSEFNDVITGKVRLEDTTIVEAQFLLEPEDKEALPAEFRECEYLYGRRPDNSSWHALIGGPAPVRYGDIKKDLVRSCAHLDARVQPPSPGVVPTPRPSAELDAITRQWSDNDEIKANRAAELKGWLERVFPLIEEGNATEEKRYDDLMSAVTAEQRRYDALKVLHQRLPIFVRFRDFFRVRPIIHLEHLGQRIENGLLDDQYDYGNICLLRLLGFSARDLSDLGKTTEPGIGDAAALQKYRDQLDRRSYQLNAASVRLTEELRRVWVPDAKRVEADRLRVVADGQYLKVVVEDDLGVEIELDQRSEGFQWLVSFFVVFFAEAADRHKNAVLLLDEPGLSLHGLKQRDFRGTISRLAEKNQLLYTTHSPFLVGPDELDLVRVVEMTDRNVGTKVRTRVTAQDPVALLPLQEALGYDLAQSLFSQQRNLVLECLTDYWYVDAVAQLLREANIVDLNDKITLLPASQAGKVVYYATILHAHKLKVAALLDSDTAADQARNQEILVHSLGNKAVIRTKDAYEGPVEQPAVEDLLRKTLVEVAKNELGWDVSEAATNQRDRSITEIFSTQVPDFSRYSLAKAFLRWTRDHRASDLSDAERAQWKKLISTINWTLK